MTRYIGEFREGTTRRFIGIASVEPGQKDEFESYARDHRFSPLPNPLNRKMSQWYLLNTEHVDIIRYWPKDHDSARLQVDSPSQERANTLLDEILSGYYVKESKIPYTEEKKLRHDIDAGLFELKQRVA